jgi:hypothetical protein
VHVRASERARDGYFAPIAARVCVWVYTVKATMLDLLMLPDEMLAKISNMIDVESLLQLACGSRQLARAASHCKSTTSEVVWLFPEPEGSILACGYGGNLGCKTLDVASLPNLPTSTQPTYLQLNKTHSVRYCFLSKLFPGSRDTDGVPGVAALLQPVDCRKAVRPERHTHTPRTHAYATRTQSARVHARSEPQNSHPVARVTSPRYLAALPRRVTWPRCDARRGRARRGTVRAEFGLS